MKFYVINNWYDCKPKFWLFICFEMFLFNHFCVHFLYFSFNFCETYKVWKWITIFFFKIFVIVVPFWLKMWCFSYVLAKGLASFFSTGNYVVKSSLEIYFTSIFFFQSFQFCWKLYIFFVLGVWPSTFWIVKGH